MAAHSKDDAGGAIRAPVDTLSDSLGLLEGEPLANKLALMLAKAVVNKLSESLSVVIVKKPGYTGS